MDPKLNSALTRAFNQFLKDIYHSSTLSLKIRVDSEGIYQFISSGVSNRLMKNINKSFGGKFTDQIALKLLEDNVDHLLKLLKDETGKTFEYVELQPKSSFEYYAIFLRECPPNSPAD